jgi:hypothetical protein
LDGGAVANVNDGECFYGICHVSLLSYACVV